MAFRYYYDARMLDALFRYRMRPYLADLEESLRGMVMPPVDIKKLTEKMQRANDLLGRAAALSERGEQIMSNFEQHLNGADSHFSAIEEYDKALALMQQMAGNGGPPLDDKSSPPPPPPPISPTVDNTIDHATGDRKRS